MDADLGEITEGFGERLEVAIKQRGLSITELGRESLLSRWTIMNWMHMKARPEMGGLRRLARVLGVKAEDLLGREPDDGAVDTVEKFFAWKSQQQYQEIVLLRSLIEAEVERRLAAGPVQGRGRPAKVLTPPIDHLSDDARRLTDEAQADTQARARQASHGRQSHLHQGTDGEAQSPSARTQGRPRTKSDRGSTRSK